MSNEQITTASEDTVEAGPAFGQWLQLINHGE